VAEPSGNPPRPQHSARSAAHYACQQRLSPLAGDKTDAPALCTIPFRPYCGSVITRTRNVSEYMLVLALCLVDVCAFTPVAVLINARCLNTSVCTKVVCCASVNSGCSAAQTTSEL